MIVDTSIGDAIREALDEIPHTGLSLANYKTIRPFVICMHDIGRILGQSNEKSLDEFLTEEWFEAWNNSTNDKERIQLLKQAIIHEITTMPIYGRET